MSFEFETDRPTSRLAIRLLYSLPYLLLIYILSTGPMYWKIYEAYQPNGSPFVRSFYYPVVWACEESDYISNYFHWYATLWAFRY